MIRLTALGELSYTLLIPEAPTSSFIDEFNEVRSRTNGNEALLDESDPGSPLVRWVEDTDGNVVEITIQPQEPQPLGEQLITITPTESSGTPTASPPPDTETVDLAEVPAAPALLSSGLFDPACRDPASLGDIESDRECVREAVGQLTVREWIELQDAGPGPGISAPCH